MNFHTLKTIKKSQNKDFWIIIDDSCISKEIQPEFKCNLFKKSHFFTNSYTFSFFDDYIITSKVSQIKKHFLKFIRKIKNIESFSLKIYGMNSAKLRKHGFFSKN